jgi:hypothetical protein
VIDMTTILAFVAAHMGFLWSDARFRIVGSEVSTSNGGDALLVVESEHLRLRFACDRRQLLLDFQPVAVAEARDWFSVDLIRRLFLGRREMSAVLDESYADFLGRNLEEIDDRFSPQNWPETRRDLRRLERVRAEEMFG